MKKLFILIALLAGSGQSAQAQLNGAYTQRLNDVFDSVCNRFNIKGATAAIVVPGQGIWERAHGISHPGMPITNDMYMGISSNTKTYFAVLMLKLQEQGKLDLDDTIGQWIQHANVPGSITIRQLLNHTSGLYSYTSNPDINNYILADFTKVWPADSVLNLVKAPLTAPGGAWDYSNTNYLLAGLIIRSVTGKTMQQALRDEILTPQGLNETYFFPQETPAGTIPHSWSANLSGNGTHEDLIAVHNYSHNAMFSLASSAGAIMATAKDNALFWDKLMSGQILNSSSMTEFETLVPISMGQGYGLGVFKLNSFNGRTIVSHGGTNIGFINENIHEKASGVSITILTNQDSISNNILLGGCIAALHKVTIQYTDVADFENSKTQLAVYPNPSRDMLKVGVANNSAEQLTIYDMAGRMVLNTVLQNGENQVSITGIGSGTYILTAIKETRTVHRQTIQVVK
ncbi:MAG: serine hydrolase [Taibaiella sp.]|nr:serine hydrolase [Taibaiella sp.]